MKQKELNEKVALLRDGQIVEIENEWFQAVRLPDNDDEFPCLICDVDCVCRGDVNTICAALEDYGRCRWFLKLAHPL